MLMLVCPHEAVMCMQVQERTQQHAAASTYTPTLDMPWETRSAFCQLLVYPAGQVGGSQLPRRVAAV